MTGNEYERATGERIPWIGLVAIAGVMVTALASVALGLVDVDGPNPPPGQAVGARPG